MGAPNAQKLQQPLGPSEPEAWKGIIPDDRYREYKVRRATLLTVSSNPVNLTHDIEEIMVVENMGDAQERTEHATTQEDRHYNMEYARLTTYLHGEDPADWRLYVPPLLLKSFESPHPVCMNVVPETCEETRPLPEEMKKL